MIQWIIVGVIVVAAAAYIIRHIYKAVNRKKGDCGCGCGCEGCNKGKC